MAGARNAGLRPISGRSVTADRAASQSVGGVDGDGVGEADGVSSGALGSVVALGVLAAAAELEELLDEEDDEDDDEDEEEDDEAELDPPAAPVELEALPEPG